MRHSGQKSKILKLMGKRSLDKSGGKVLIYNCVHVQCKLNWKIIKFNQSIILPKKSEFSFSKWNELYVTSSLWMKTKTKKNSSWKKSSSLLDLTLEKSVEIWAIKTHWTKFMEKSFHTGLNQRWNNKLQKCYMLQMLQMLHCPRAGFLNRRLATRQRVVAEFEWVLVNRFGAMISAKS